MNSSRMTFGKASTFFVSSVALCLQAQAITWQWRAQTRIVGTTTNYYAWVCYKNYSSCEWDAVIDKKTTGAVVMPDVLGTKYIPKWIEENAFRGCQYVTSITLPDSVTSIGDNAFYGCKALTSFTFPKGITHIKRSWFWQCYKLTSMTIPAHIVSADNEWDSGYIRNLTIVPGRTEIDASIISHIDGIENIALPEGLLSLPDSAFEGDTGLKTVNIPASVTSIGRRPFCNCNSLTTISVAADNPNYSVNGLSLCNKAGDTLVYAHESAGRYTVPQAVTNIADGAFDGVEVTNILFTGDAPVVSAESFRNLSTNTLITVYDEMSGWELDSDGRWHGMRVNVELHGQKRSFACGSGNVYYDISRNTYACITGSDDTLSGEITIPAMLNDRPVEQICEGAFKNRTGITRIDLPEGIKGIHEDAFLGCSSLTAITLPSTLEFIEEEVFKGCEALHPGEDPLIVDGWLLAVRGTVPEDVVVPEGIRGIAEDIYLNNPNLKSVRLPKSLQYIGEGAFFNCAGLTNILFRGNAPADFYWTCIAYNRKTESGGYIYDHMDWIDIQVLEGSTGWNTEIPGTWYGNPIRYADFGHGQIALETIAPTTVKETAVAESMANLVQSSHSSESFDSWCANRVSCGGGTLAAALAAAPQPKLDYVFDKPLGTFSDEPKIEIAELDASSGGLTFRVKDGDAQVAIEKLNAAVSLYASTDLDGLESQGNRVTPDFAVNADGTVTLVLPDTDSSSGFYSVVIP